MHLSPQGNKPTSNSFTVSEPSILQLLLFHHWFSKYILNVHSTQRPGEMLGTGVRSGNTIPSASLPWTLRIWKGRRRLYVFYKLRPLDTFSRSGPGERVDGGIEGNTLLLTLNATRCTTCWGSLSRITLQRQRRDDHHSNLLGDSQTTQPTCLSTGVITPPPHPRSREVQASQRTHPPSTISSTAKKSPSMFSSRARFSTFFLSPPKKKRKKKQPLCERNPRTLSELGS